MLGGLGFDVLIGGAGDDSIDGGAGNDILEGQQGNDTLLGGDGNDVIRGLQGEDVIIGGRDAGAYAFATGPGGTFVEVTGGDRINLTRPPGSGPFAGEGADGARDRVLYSVANDDGVDLVRLFARGEDVIEIALGGDPLDVGVFVQQVGTTQTLITFGTTTGAIVVDTPGLVLGTDIVFV